MWACRERAIPVRMCMFNISWSEFWPDCLTYSLLVPSHSQAAEEMEFELHATGNGLKCSQRVHERSLAGLLPHHWGSCCWATVAEPRDICMCRQCCAVSWPYVTCVRIGNSLQTHTFCTSFVNLVYEFFIFTCSDQAKSRDRDGILVADTAVCCYKSGEAHWTIMRVLATCMAAVHIRCVCANCLLSHAVIRTFQCDRKLFITWQQHI
jgi:hypothetical protein